MEISKKSFLQSFSLKKNDLLGKGRGRVKRFGAKDRAGVWSYSAVRVGVVRVSLEMGLGWGRVGG